MGVDQSVSVREVFECAGGLVAKGTVQQRGDPLGGLPLRVVEGVPAAEAIQQILAGVRQHFRLDIAFVAEFCDGQRVFRYLDAATGADEIIHVGDADPLEASYCEQVLDGRLPEVIPDCQVLPAARALPVTTALPVGAHLGVPIRFSDGTLYGTFCGVSRQADPSLHTRDAAVMRLLAGIVASYLERDRIAGRARGETFARVERALTRDGVAIVFQPIIELGTGRVAGYEALARFHEPTHTDTEQWFRDAHDAGLGVELEVAATRAALTHIDRLDPSTFLNLNASAAALASPEFAEAIATHPVPEQLVIELTEHDQLVDYEAVRADLAPYRSAGIRLALDDAGSGYAGLRRILGLEPDLIKLDLELTRGIAADPARQAMAAALAWFGARTHTALIAEGIEAQPDLDAITSFDITYGQGYLLGRPARLPNADTSALTTEPKTRLRRSA
jgi:EAL domain-containing protein (putative c-di-GMP-specific phosphodiesterase class I)